jgi:hypothetical protein
MISWIYIARGKSNQFLIAFAAIPSLIYFVAALLYYPTWMILNGFDILAFGQIFWVAVYGLQGIYLLNNFKIKNFPTIIVGLFLVASFAIQYFTKTFGLFDTTNFSPWLVKGEYLVLVIILISTSIVQMKRAK